MTKTGITETVQVVHGPTPHDAAIIKIIAQKIAEGEGVRIKVATISQDEDEQKTRYNAVFYEGVIGGCKYRLCWPDNADAKDLALETIGPIDQPKKMRQRKDSGYEY